MSDKTNSSHEYLLNSVYSIVRFLREDELIIPVSEDERLKHQLLKIIAHHGLIAHILGHKNFSKLDSYLKIAIKRLYLTTSVRNTQLFETYNRVSDSFKLNEIEFIPLKGAFLLPSIYGDIAARNISDLDILIYPKDYNRCKSLLLEMGASQLEADSESFLQNLGNHYSAYWLFNTSIELHFRILPLNLRYTIPVEDVWNNLVNYPTGAIQSKGIEPNLLILYLAMHIHYSEMRGEFRAYWYMDIAKLIENKDLVDTEILLKLAQKYKNLKPLIKVLAKVIFLFNIKIDGVKELNCKEEVEFVDNLSQMQLSSNKGYSIAIERVLYTKGFFNKLRFIKLSIFNGTDNSSQVLFKRVSTVGKKLIHYLTKRR